MTSRLAPALILGSLFAVGVMGSSVILGHAVQQASAARASISVKGVAEKAIRADHAQWKATVTVRAATIAEGISALHALVNSSTTALAQRSGLNVQSFTHPDWTSTPVYTKLENGSDGALIGYDLSQDIGIVLNDVLKPIVLNKAAEDLMSSGVNIHDTSTQYLVGNLEKIKLSLIGQATKNAHDRAVEFAKSGDVNVGAMRSASQGIFQIRNPLSTDSEGGDYDTTTVDKIARVVVTVDYAIRN